MLDTALHYAGAGFAVFPCHGIDSQGGCTCGDTDCKSPGKHPSIAGGVKEATTDEAKIREWDWEGRNIGGTPPKGTFVLDVDPRHRGDLSLAWLESQHGTLPTTLTSRTGSGGTHLFFRGEGIRQSAGVIDEGLDVRVSGKGYVILPPSMHVSGGTYRWKGKMGGIAEAPEWLLRLAQLRERAPGEPKWEELDEGSGRNDALHRWLSGRRARGASNDDIRGLARHRNAQMKVPLDDVELEMTVLKSVLGYEQGTEFICGKSGAPVAGDPENLVTAVRSLGFQLRRDLFSGREAFIHAGGPTGPITDEWIKRLRGEIKRKFGFLPTREATDIGLELLLHQGRYHPVRDYLDGLKWDGVPRIDTWLIVHLGAEDTPLNRAFGRKWLVGGVRRVRRPGVKFDHMLILEGIQGLGKSTVLRELAVQDDWFTDSASLFEGSRELLESVQGKLIIEESELHTLRKAEVERVKRVLSAVATRGRPAYARMPVDMAHQFIVAGTTNDSHYLKDTSGGRRFWVVKCEGHLEIDENGNPKTRVIDLEKFRSVRDQLWAEAAEAEAAGEAIGLPETLWEAQSEAVEDRREEIGYEDELGAILGDLEGRLRMSTIREIFGIEPGKWQGFQSRMVIKAMKNLGWEYTRLRVEGRLQRLFVRGRSDRILESQDLNWQGDM